MGDSGCFQGDDSPAHTASRTIATLIMIFNPVDASVASIVWAKERTGPGLRHFIQDFSFRRYLCFFFFILFRTFENRDSRLFRKSKILLRQSRFSPFKDIVMTKHLWK